METWLGDDNYCLPDISANGTIIQDQYVCKHHSIIYTASLYWAVMTITSIGYGDIGATPHNASEQGVCTALMLLGAVVWGYVIGTFCGTIANLSPATEEFRRNLDDLNTYMVRNRVDAALRQRLRDYFHRARHLHDSSNQKRLLSMMSPMLQSEVVLAVAARGLRRSGRSRI